MIIVRLVQLEFREINDGCLYDYTIDTIECSIVFFLSDLCSVKIVSKNSLAILSLYMLVALQNCGLDICQDFSNVELSPSYEVLVVLHIAGYQHTANTPKSLMFPNLCTARRP